MSPAILLFLQIAVPAVLTFIAGHYHWVIPNPLATPTPGGPNAPPLPTTVGHGEILNWLLDELMAMRRATPTPTPPAVAQAMAAAVPQAMAQALGTTQTIVAAPHPTDPAMVEVLAILRQALQVPPPAPAPSMTATGPSWPKAA